MTRPRHVSAEIPVNLGEPEIIVTARGTITPGRPATLEEPAEETDLDWWIEQISQNGAPVSEMQRIADLLSMSPPFVEAVREALFDAADDGTEGEDWR